MMRCIIFLAFKAAERILEVSDCCVVQDLTRTVTFSYNIVTYCGLYNKEYKFLKILQSMNLGCKYLIKITMRSRFQKKKLISSNRGGRKRP